MKLKFAVLILMLAAAIFLSISLSSVIRSARLKKHGVQTESTVTGRIRNKGLLTVTVSFRTPDGNQVVAKAVKRYAVSTGEKVMIWYDPVSPAKIDFGDTIGYNMRGVIASGLLFIIGFYYFMRYSITDKANKKLITSGMKIEAEFVSIDRDERFRAGDKNPWIIRCKWTDNRNSKEYSFVSKTYTIDPVTYLNGRYYIDVYIDPSDPRRYYMDTSFMPKGNNTIG